MAEGNQKGLRMQTEKWMSWGGKEIEGDPQEVTQKYLLQAIADFERTTGYDGLEIMAGVISTAATITKDVEHAAGPTFLHDMRERPGQGIIAQRFYDVVAALLRLHEVATADDQEAQA